MSLKIMVVDDEPKSALLMRALATPLGHSVLPFEDYEAAAQKAESQAFDVSFVGMLLPALSGLELAHRIRNSHANHDSAIVMLTATNDIPSLRKAFGEGADLVLTKPVQADHLLRMLAAMDTPDWKSRKAPARLALHTDVTCTWNDRQFLLRSLNISQTGMLLQPSLDAAVGEEVLLEFKIAEVPATLKVPARITRKDGTQRVGVGFIGLEPEDQNAIQVYVAGHLKELTPRRGWSDFGPRRMFRS